MSLLKRIKNNVRKTVPTKKVNTEESMEDGWRDTLSRWETVVAANPEDVTAQLQVIHAYAHLDNHEVARQKMSDLETRLPQDRTVQHNSAKLLLNLGDHESAKQRWESMCDGSDSDIEPYISLASLILTQEDLEGAEQMIDAALAIDSDEMRALILKAKIKQKKEDWAPALELWLRINRKRKVHYESDLQIALCQLKLDQHEAAIKTVDESLGKHDRIIPLLQVKIKALNRLGRSEECISVIDQALELQSGKHEMNYEKARILMQLDQLDQAETACEIALNADPRNIQYLTLYARIGQRRVNQSNAA